MAASLIVCEAASLIVCEYIGSEPDGVRIDGSESDSVRIGRQ